MDHKTQIKWWEPYRETLRTGFTDLRSAGVMRPGFWVRVVVVSASAIGLVVAVMLLAYPGMWLPWTQLISGLLICPAMIAFGMGLTMLAPRHVEVRREWIQFSHGQSAVRIRAQDLRSISLEERQEGELRLRLDYVTRRGMWRTRECAVSSTVCRDTLEMLVAHLSEDASRHASPPAAPGV